MPVDPTIGQLIHSIVSNDLEVEKDGWAVELVSRAAAPLLKQEGIPEDFQIEVVWLDGYRAFTTPGRYIYISRRLLERCSSEEAAAFIIAHEIGHHVLGHFDLLPDWLMNSHGKELTIFAVALYRGFERFFFGPESEAEADKFALELCLRAGFDGEKALSVFDVLEHRALDKGDVDGVFGPLDFEDLEEEHTLSSRFQVWLFERTRGYPPLRQRRQMLEALLD